MEPRITYCVCAEASGLGTGCSAMYRWSGVCLRIIHCRALQIDWKGPCSHSTFEWHSRTDRLDGRRPSGRVSIPLADGNSISKRILGSSLDHCRFDGQSPAGIGESLWTGRNRHVFGRLYRSHSLPGSFWRAIDRALARIPEVRTLRAKLEILCREAERAARWQAALARA